MAKRLQLGEGVTSAVHILSHGCFCVASWPVNVTPWHIVKAHREAKWCWKGNSHHSGVPVPFPHNFSLQKTAHPSGNQM